LKGVPVYISALRIYELSLNALNGRLKLTGESRPSYYLRYVTVWSRNGDPASLVCFHKGCKVDRRHESEMAREHNFADAWECAGLIESLIGLAVQYAQPDIYDERGEFVPMEDRTVLDPKFLANGLEALSKQGMWTGEAIKGLLRSAPEVSVCDDRVKHVRGRTAVTIWGSTLGIKRSGNDIKGVDIPYFPHLYSIHESRS
jgi:hypothetical protein